MIVGLFGQLEYGRTSNKYTNYAAFAAALFDCIGRNLAFEGISQVIIPKYIGCGLGGGEWAVVEQLILDVEQASGVTFTCVDFDTKL